MIQYQRGQKIELTIEKMAPNGVALSHLPDGRAAFIKAAAPGEIAEVRLTRIKKDFAEGEFVRIIQPSSSRAALAFAPEALSGANWAYLDYAVQAHSKQAIVAELLSRFAKIELPLTPLVTAEQKWRYRNKVELTFGQDQARKITLGFHAPGRFDQIIPTQDVALFPEVAQAIIRAVTGWANQHDLTSYDARRKSGLLRNLVIRRAEHGEDLLINLVTTPAQELPGADQLVEILQPVKPTGVLWTENASVATIVRADTTHLLAGQPFIGERFLGKTIRYQADSFFQTNTPMAERLAQTVLERLVASQLKLLVDAYAGVGGFGLFAAARGINVMSIESHVESSADARANADRLGVLEKMTFVRAPMEEYLKEYQLPTGAVVIVDPPRSGLHPKALAALAQANLERFFYVSCGPTTLARDLAILAVHYQPIFIQAFDLFPQTSHIETVVELAARE